ncbi:MULTISPECIES: adenine phosphoribosyltransferase [unclassified Granulicatella]|uniref:adenine phosphoribosyltransferase n=1 Tax=unclassified Granulicatella TaxID=2630493 RepID=UPI0010744DC7|nr:MULTISPECIES: adenine phosphoribosyltransferase [unclassified Granulicatella]MBF0780110.1 adenine phosphoribosyltransferase [Granulicatella sp. 19428wC4_WM01]TFU95776.1 adenine phosphoribosyltransferase [Granulicatella sp. WM01]
MNIEEHILTIPDFPKKGILFRDTMPLIANGELYQYVTNEFATYAKEQQVDVVIGPEARGFLFGCPVAHQLGVGFVPVRKQGKLAGETISVSYELEYGEAVLEMNTGSIKPGQRVLICDDLLATGGTIEATIQIVEAQGGIVAGIMFIIELTGLNGREKLKGYPIKSLISYD